MTWQEERDEASNKHWVGVGTGNDSASADFRAGADWEHKRCEDVLGRVQDLVNEQAEDEGLWSVPWEGLQPIAEAHLQQELRKLHAAVEKALTLLQGIGGKLDAE